MSRLSGVTLVLAVALTATACGSRHSRATARTTFPATTTAPASVPVRTTATVSTGAPGALQAEATAAATGDIPDNQVFLSFRAPAGYSLKYPEGWAQSGAGGMVAFRDKNNQVRVVVRSASRPTAASIGREVAALHGVRITAPAVSLTLPGGPADKIVYRTVSAPNPVTAKRVTLTVDRYYLWRGGKEAVLDLGTPVGVDNIDAYRLISESFRWR